MDYQFSHDNNGNPYIKTTLSDYALILHPLLNKGMAFSAEERELFNLWGLLPPSQVDLSLQRLRSYEAFRSKLSDVEKYIYLRDLQDSNETLYYSLLTEHLEEMLPIVYTPTVGLGCQRFSHIYRRPRGIFFSYPNRNHIEKILANPRFNGIRVIVVSDGERILGLGDQGAGGMGIPIGKLALYTACAGIYPGYTLPILLDSGTNNPELQKDPLYIGWSHDRIRGEEYAEFVDIFVNAVKNRFPHVLLQWEDFAQINANPLLQRYRNSLCTFNDDIQGTAAVTVGTLLAALYVTDIPLKDQRIVIVGAGSAGCGISTLIKKLMVEEGLSEEEARGHFYLMDKDGLLMEGYCDAQDFQKPFLQRITSVMDWHVPNNTQISLLDVIRHAKPTLLIGVSGQPGIFTEDVVREMAKHVERPIIFPLSNPTTRSEANPVDLLRWTEGRAVIGTGSPFGQVDFKGKSYRIDQTNNCYIFPGVGLGLIAVKSQFVSDKMFMLAAKALAESSPARLDKNANLLPPINQIRDVSLKVAIAVANEAIQSGLAGFIPEGDLPTFIRNIMWQPEYLPYKKV